MNSYFCYSKSEFSNSQIELLKKNSTIIVEDVFIYTSKEIISFEALTSFIAQIKTGSLSLTFYDTSFRGSEYYNLVFSEAGFEVYQEIGRNFKYLLVDFHTWYSALEYHELWRKRPVTKLDQNEFIVFDFYWVVSGSDFSVYESTDISCFVTNKGRKINFGNNGDFSNFYGHRGYGIFGGSTNEQVESPSREEILYSMGITYVDKISSVSGGEVELYSQDYLLLKKAGISDVISVPAYTGLDYYTLYNENQDVKTLLDTADGKCVEVKSWEESFDERELISTKYFWFFPNKESPVVLGVNKTFRLLKKFGGIISSGMENIQPTEGEGWKLI